MKDYPVRSYLPDGPEGLSKLSLAKNPFNIFIYNYSIITYYILRSYSILIFI